MSLSSSVETAVAAARRIASETVAPDAEDVDSTARWPERGLRRLCGELGGLVLPESCGGRETGLVGLLRVCEELGRSCASTAICFGMHCVASAVLAAKATADHQARYLAPIARGEHMTTLALSESGSGAHFYLPATRLVKADDGYVLHGRKVFVTNGEHADSYVVSAAAADPEAPPGHFSCLVVPAGADNLRWSQPWRGFGMRGNASATLELAGVRLPERERLGAEGDQIWFVFQVIAPFFLGAMAGTYLGVASRALDAAREHVEGRGYEMSGRTVADESVVQHRIGTLWARLQATRQFAYWAADEYDRGGEQALAAVLAMKAEVGECAERLTNEALTLVGGVGYREGSLLQRLLRDARAAHVMSPTTDLLRCWTGRVLLGRPVL